MGYVKYFMSETKVRINYGDKSIHIVLHDILPHC